MQERDKQQNQAYLPDMVTGLACLRISGEKLLYHLIFLNRMQNMPDNIYQLYHR